MDNSPLITCVIPTYCRPRMVERAIRSVLAQTFTRLRVFVTDNASGDETADLIRSIQERDSRVVYHCQPSNIGMNANIAYGMAHVETPFFSLLSDDDVLLPKFYELAYSEFLKYPQAFFVATKVPCVTEDGKFIDEPLSLWDRFGMFEPPTGAHRVATICHPTITGILFRCEIIDAIYSHIDRDTHAADYEIILNAAAKYPMVTVDQPGALFIQHQGPRALPPDPFIITNQWMDLIRKIDEDCRFPSEIKAKFRQRYKIYLTGYLRGLIIRFCTQGEFDKAKIGLGTLRTIDDRIRLYATLQFLYFICYRIPGIRLLMKYARSKVISIRKEFVERKMNYIEPKYLSLLKRKEGNHATHCVFVREASTRASGRNA